MSALSRPTAQALELQSLADLRGRAAFQLKGTAATKGVPASAADALNVLHALASSPATASDALTLLHELQVYQVELALQAQELQESRVELETALRRQVELYHFQPGGCFTIDHRGALHELNQAGADMLGLARDDAYGLRLDAFVCAESARQIRSAMSCVDAGARRTTRRLRLCPRGGAERSIMASIGADPAAQRYLVNFTDAADEQGQQPEVP